MRPPSSSRGFPERLTRKRQLFASPVAVLRDGAMRPWLVGRPRGRVTENPEWAIAMSVPIRVHADGALGDTRGVMTARRHPTGWFIAASHRTEMSAEELADFRHFVHVRVHLLLRHGAQSGAWAHDASSEQWRADVPAAAVLNACRIPQGVPDSWNSPSPPAGSRRRDRSGHTS